MVLEGLAFEAWDLRFVERKVKGDNVTVFDIGVCCGGYAGGSEEVNAANLKR